MAMELENGPQYGAAGAVTGEALPAKSDEPAAAASRPGEIPQPTATARVLRLEPGLYAIAIGEIGGAGGEIADMMVPSIQITAPLSDHLDPVEIIAASSDTDSWLGADGGTVVVRAPPGGGRVLITVYARPDQPTGPLHIEIRRLDRAPPANAAAGRPAESATPPAPTPASRSREVRTEVAVHIERTGDRRYPGQGWVGTRGQKLRIEAFGLKPLETLSAGDIEYKAFAPDDRETPWVGDGKLCGTRGRGLPLTGFAMRLSPHLRERFDIVYQGSFFEGGIAGPKRNGEICASTIANDPLEAVNIRLIERIGR